MKRLVTLTMAAAALIAAPAAHAERWKVDPDLPAHRSAAAPATLADGSLLLIGGLAFDQPATDAVTRFDPATGAWTDVAPMGSARFRPIATVLADGRVLVAGGVGDNTVATASAEVYDPATNTWSPVTNELRHPRYDLGMEEPTLLRDGTVLFAGAGDEASTDVDVYDPVANAFEPVASLDVERGTPSQTLLSDGRVLVAGGVTAAELLDSGEVYDPATNDWTPVANALQSGRAGSFLVTLPDGKALSGGGILVDEDDGFADSTHADLYDPATNRFTPSGGMNGGHIDGIAERLADGRVLVAGGAEELALGAELQGAELYDPATGNWTATPAMPRPLMSAASFLLPDGSVLLAGGTQSLEPVDDVQVYVPSTPPSAPRAVTAVAGDATATASWTAPARDGDNPITSYTVTASTGQTATATGSQTSATVTGLANGTPVTFTVTATTSFATGPASEPSAPVTPTAPVVPAVIDPPDTTKPKLTISGLRKQIKRRALTRKGLRFRVRPNERARVVVRLVRGEKVVAKKRFAASTRQRKVRLKPRRRAVRKAKRVVVRIVATDTAGNRTAVRRTVKLRRPR
jgi:hypothetical protein